MTNTQVILTVILTLLILSIAALLFGFNTYQLALEDVKNLETEIELVNNTINEKQTEIDQLQDQLAQQQEPEKTEPIINNFIDCVGAGNAITGVWPERTCKGPKGAVYYENIYNADNYKDSIIITEPQPNQVITTPLQIKGKANGWFFEGDFPVRLITANGVNLGISYVTGSLTWMDPGMQDFAGTIEFDTPHEVSCDHGFLVITEDNPGLDSMGCQELSTIYIPVKFR